MDKMTLLIKPKQFSEEILRTETCLTQKDYNNWLHNALEILREIYDDDASANTLFGDVLGDVINMLSNTEIEFVTKELNEDNMFDLCANKSMSEIEELMNKARSTKDTDNDYEFNWDVVRQAIRYYMSRLLEGYTEEEPLDGIHLLVGTDDEANYENEYIIKMYQDEIDGTIWCMMDYNIDYFGQDFDDFSTGMQYDLLKQLVNCI